MVPLPLARRRVVHVAVGLAVAASFTLPFAHTAHAATSTTQQLIADPGFEDGTPTSSWVQTQNPNNGSYPLIVNFGNPHTGSWYADLCAIDNCVDQLTQGFTAPGQVTSATLSFWYEISTGEASNNSACHDHLQVGLGVNGGLDASTLQQLCSVTNGYVQSSFDVTAFLNAHGGQTVDVILLGATNDTFSSEFFVDDLALNATYLTTPSKVTNLSAVSSAPSSATVTWSPPQFPLGSTPSSYTVTPYINGNAQSSLTQTVSGTTANFTTLTNASTYWFAVVATNVNGTGPPANSYSVTPRSSATPTMEMSAVSSPAVQYQLTNSDGSTWQDMDGNTLALSFTPPVTEEAVLTGNADLWTGTAGFNQDIGLLLNNSVVGWKESGGGAAQAPNAAFVQAVVPVQASTTYTLRLDWKTNKPAAGINILAGAGGTGNFSPSRLAVQLEPAPSSTTDETYSSPPSTQYALGGSDGHTWQNIDSSKLALPMSASSAGTLIISGNADLWTSKANVNQDLGLLVNGSLAGSSWKESGGGATFSPNAAYVVAAYHVAGAGTLNVSLAWKTNVATSSPIFAGAGAPGAYSPTSLTAIFVPASSQSAVSATQRSLANSDGTTWHVMDGGDKSLTLTFTTPADDAAHTWYVGANSDLWTANLGYNQDIGICYAQGATVPTCSGSAILGWKESGGLLAAFSPNAAMLQSSVVLQPGTQYTFTLVWKANRNASGATIFSGAGTSNHSPTTLLAQIAG